MMGRREEEVRDRLCCHCPPLLSGRLPSPEDSLRSCQPCRVLPYVPCGWLGWARPLEASRIEEDRTGVQQ